MNNRPLPKVLLGLITILALWSLILCFMFISRAKQVRDLQAQVNAMNMKQQVLNLLVNDAVEYSKTHPAMEPILQSIGINKNSQAPASPAAAPRTGTK